MELYMFGTVPLSIIRRFHCTHSNGICHNVLQTAFVQDQDGMELDALISQIYSWNGILHVWDSSSLHHQKFFTVHTAMVYVIQFCRQLSSRTRMELLSILVLLESCQQNCMTYTIAVCTVKNF